MCRSPRTIEKVNFTVAPRFPFSADPLHSHGAVCQCQGRRLLPPAGEHSGRGAAGGHAQGGLFPLIGVPPWQRSTSASFCPQIDVSYNVPDPVANPAFQLLVNLQEPKPKRHRRAPHPAKPASPDKNRSEASHREMVSGDDDDPAADQDHREYKIAMEACVRWALGASLCTPPAPLPVEAADRQ